MRVLWIGIFLCVILCGCRESALVIQPIKTAALLAATPTDQPITFGTGGRVRRDIVYCAPDGVPELMDLYFPHTPKRVPTPVLLFMSESEMDKAIIRFQELDELLARGYLIASINVREPPTFKFPIAVEDAKCAVRFLRASATTYRLDPNRIGAWGCSKGGYLSAMLGLVPASAGMEGTGGYAAQSSAVKAVVVEDVISDMHDFAAGVYELGYLFGVTSHQAPILDRASPVTYAAQDASPFLLFASDAGSGFWMGQASKLNTRLQAAGVPSSIVPVTHAEHCWEMYSIPSAEEVAAQIGDFFDEQLK